ncbi:MAG: flagellar hook-length control protein FliK, partial [Lamprobacter sp.]|uniref:flagellar hook-length control protein FliK n=1 Tax=Lamprobacter sp. TaxID=3100796 RepID=UPI002B258D7F
TPDAFGELLARLTPEPRTSPLTDWGQRPPQPERMERLRETANLATVANTLPPRAPAPLEINGAILAAQPSAEQAARATFSEPFSTRDQRRTDGRAGSGLSFLASEQRAALSAEAPRTLAELSTTAPATREPFVPTLRELLGVHLASREGFVNPQPSGTSTLGAETTAAGGLGLGIANASLASYSAIAGGQSNSAAQAPGMSASLYSAAWPQQLGQQLVLLSQRGGDQRVELRLNPPDLGPLTVSLRVGEQGTQIQFMAASALVRTAVEQAIPQLRDALAEQGINLGETSVGEQRQEGDQAFAGDDAQQRGSANGAWLDAEDTGLADAPANIEMSLDGRVDIYA